MRKKRFGIWREYSWKDCHEKVKFFSLGLISMGLEAGDKVSILGDNNPEWFWAELATHAANAVSVGLFTDGLPAEIKFLVEHSQSKFVVAQDQEQVDKLLQIKDELPLVRKVIYWDRRGMGHYDDPILISFDEVIGLGKEYEKDHIELFEQNIGNGKGEDICMISYTSGTTGLPKGTLMTYNFITLICTRISTLNPVYESDEWFSFTLPTWNVEQYLGFVNHLLVGQKMSFPEEIETVSQDLREIAPHVLLYPSRLWEQLVQSIQTNISDTSRLKRWLYHLCLPIGYKVADISFRGRKANLFWRCLHAVAELLVFRPLRDRHGLIRIRIPFTGGAVQGPDTFRFLHAIGIKVKQIYGATEGGGTVHAEGEVKFESVGIPHPMACLRISEEGEILVDKNSSFVGYYRNPEATEKAFRGGWYHTGDAGYFAEDGHLIYIDRLDDMRQLADGTSFSPQYIESRLKFSPYVRDVLAIGGEQREFVGAIVNINFDNVGDWAEKKRIPYTTFVDLSQKAEVGELIAKEIKKVNSNLPPNSRVKCFVNLHKEFDADEAELTRTRKVRRAFVEDRYKELIEAIYGEKEEVTVEASVTYKDGRTGVVSSKIRVMHIT